MHPIQMPMKIYIFICDHFIVAPFQHLHHCFKKLHASHLTYSNLLFCILGFHVCYILTAWTLSTKFVFQILLNLVSASPGAREGRRGCAGEGVREREREVLSGWCSTRGDGGIERDGDRGFSALGGDGEDGGREWDGSER
eukprot:TRINITY_DN9960_c0_g1_i3.p1 TRINITY_DN9960_c0_g1~~TRINITY_DN9960_c0_g1_i3.p1  ORF type:complete len:140 (-),score=13.66 TRINITY_DN9960_c0_g1_i3:135-554(-)